MSTIQINHTSYKVCNYSKTSSGSSSLLAFGYFKCRLVGLSSKDLSAVLLSLLISLKPKAASYFHRLFNMKRMDLLCASPASTAVCSSIDHRSMVRHRGHRPIDLHHHRRKPKPYAPCSSQLPVIPKPYNNSNHDHHQKSGRKSSAKQTDSRRKSSADITDLNRDSSHGSSRYLLSDKPFIDWMSESDHHATALVRSQSAKPKLITSSNDSPSLKSSSTNKSRDKVCFIA